MFLIILISYCVMAETITKDFPLNKINALNFRSGSGDVQIQSNDNKKIQISANKKKFDEKCELKMIEEKNQLEVEVKGSNCQVDFSISIPNNLDLDIKLGAGDVKIDKISSKNLNLKLGAGDVSVTYEKTDVSSKDKNYCDLKLGAGDIKISMPKTNQVHSSIKVGWGDIKNAFEQSKNGFFDLSIQLGAGDISISKE